MTPVQTRVPGRLTDRAGAELSIRRAWPRSDGRVIFEASEVESGRIRAGTISTDGTARTAPFGKDPRLLGLTRIAAERELLVHRYRRRAVVRSADGFVKFLPPGKAAAVAASHHLMQILARPSGIAVPGVIGYDAGSVTLTAVRGKSLHHIGRTLAPPVDRDAAPPAGRDGAPPDGPLARWDRAWRLWSRRWPLLAVTPVQATALETYGPDDEYRTVQRWIGRASDLNVLDVSPARLHAAAAAVKRLLDGASDRGLDSGPQRPVLSHRDLHDKQLLYSSDTDRIGLIDCDTMALAEPALDLGNLLAHLEFRREQNILPAAADTAVQFLLGAADTMRVPAGRLTAYAVATKLRLACLYAFRPAYAGLARVV